MGMSSFILQPSDGRWNLEGQRVDIYADKLGNTAVYHPYVEWNSDNGHNMTLVCTVTFSAKKEAEQFASNQKRILVVTADEYNPDMGIAWIKAHPTPHMKDANPHGYPWGRALSFPNSGGNHGDES